MERSIVQEIYSAGAGRYEQVMQRYWEFDRAALIATLCLACGERVLEVGVGTGKNLPHYPNGTHVMGVDFTPGMLDMARHRVATLNSRRIELREMDAQAMAFEDDQFDAAVETFVLCVAPDPALVLREMVRVTKPSARIAIFDYCRSGNEHMVKWQQLIAQAAMTTGFPPGVIIWDPLRDYEEIIRAAELPLCVVEKHRHESENPFLICCRMLLRNTK